MLNIKFDYTYDSEGFFNSPDRRAVLSYAAQLWSEVIEDDFEKIPAGSAFEIRHPSQSDQTLEITLNDDIDDLLIYVGAREISGSTLGLGGPSGYSLMGDKFTLRISDDFRNNGATENFEPWAGVLTFDSTATWNFSLDAPQPGKSDLLTVALHEIGHVLGIGTASTFDTFVQNRTFTGSNVVNLNGGVALPLHEDDAHVEDGYGDNDVLMDPTTSVGDRVLISDIDKAILADLGYSVSGFINNSSTFSLVSDAGESVSCTLLDDYLSALAGNDVVFAKAGNDEIYGDAGNDEIQGGTGNDCIDGGLGDDLLFGEEGADKIFGGSGTDQIQGGADNDILFGGEGNDNIWGGDGDDIIVSASGTDNIYTDVGHDKLYVFCDGNETWLYDFDIGEDSLHVVGSGIASAEDFLLTEITEYSNFWTFALPGQTTLRIQKLNETDDLASAQIVLESTEGATGYIPQVILGANTSDLISGGASVDTLYAGEGADSVLAGAGSDTVELGSTSTYHSGYYAHNVLTGSRISIHQKTKYSSVIDGEEDADTILLMDRPNGDAFFLHDAYSDLHASVSTTADGKGIQTAARVINVETIFAGSGDDIIDLTSDTFDMGGTNITLKGEAGDDVLWAAEGDDILEGGLGNDILFGGDGNDTLTGGDGADVFEFSHSAASQSDTISDYTSGDALKFYLGDGGSQLAETDYQSGILTWGDMTIALNSSLGWDDLTILYA